MANLIRKDIAKSFLSGLFKERFLCSFMQEKSRGGKRVQFG